MRIVFFNPIGEIGGAERVLLLLLAHLKNDAAKQSPTMSGATNSQSPLELRVLLGSDGPLRAEAERLGIAVDVFPLPAALLTFGDSQLSREHGGGRFLTRVRVLFRAALSLPVGLLYLVRIRRKLRELAPDLIHSNGLKTHLIAALARPKRAKLLWHLHDFLGDRALIGRLLRMLRGRATLAVANSDAVRDDAAALLLPLDIMTIHNGIDVDRFSPASGDVPLLDRLAGFPPASPSSIRIGLVATYARWKGHEIFLRAAAAIMRNASSSPLRFYIVGGPIYRTAGSQYSEQELRSLVAELGLTPSVGFVPFQPDTAAIYRALDVVVHAGTRREPFGLTIVEAMSCGRAVVTSAAGGAAEIAEQGVNCLTFPMGNVAELAAAIMQLAGDPALRERLGQGGRATATDRFAAPVMGRAFTELYQSLHCST